MAKKVDPPATPPPTYLPPKTTLPPTPKPTYLPPVAVKKLDETTKIIATPKPTTKAVTTAKPTPKLVTSPPPTYLPPEEDKGYKYPKPEIPFVY